MNRLLVLVLAMLVVACGGRQSVLMQDSNQTATVDTAKAEALAAEAQALWAERGSLEKANAAIAKWQEAATADATNPIYQRELSNAYYFINNVHVRWTDKDKKATELANYLKGVEAAERALGLANPAFAALIKSGEDSDEVWTKALKSARKEDVKTLYWYAVHLAKWAKLKSLPAILKYKNRALLVIQTCKTLEPEFFHGGPSRYLGTYWAALPGFAGKDTGKSKVHFDAAIKIDSTYLDTKVLYARWYATNADDEALFKKLLNEVISADPNAIPELVPENKNSQRIAKDLLENMEDYF
jgi:hemerythrin superfamily protein